jgi:hypothetical protein
MDAEKNERLGMSDMIEDFPAIRLDCAIDESSDPPEVTIFDPDGDHAASAWITAAGDAVVSVEVIQ